MKLRDHKELFKMNRSPVNCRPTFRGPICEKLEHLKRTGRRGLRKQRLKNILDHNEDYKQVFKKP
jgi:hypothetical protein